MKTTGAELIMRLLERQGIEAIAGIPGGANLPLYDALRASRIRHVLARHEQGAGFIAQGMARATGRAGGLLRHLRSRARPISSPRSPTPSSTRSRWSRSPDRCRAR